MSYIFTQTFKSTREVKHLVSVQPDDTAAREYAIALLESSADITSVRISKQMAFVQKEVKHVWC